MEAKDIQKMNDLNRDIWGMIVQAQKTKNWALIEINLKRLYSLQKKYINLINIMDYEVKGTTLILQDEMRVRRKFEKQWFKDVAERNGSYKAMKKNIDKYFGDEEEI
jgi:hypothetical protein